MAPWARDNLVSAVSRRATRERPYVKHADRDVAFEDVAYPPPRPGRPPGRGGTDVCSVSEPLSATSWEE